MYKVRNGGCSSETTATTEDRNGILSKEFKTTSMEYRIVTPSRAFIRYYSNANKNFIFMQ